jgi:hypothetical protein
MFGSGCASPVESGWFDNTGCAHRNIFFAAADAVVALQMTVQGENSENTDVNRDGRVTSLDALTILRAAACSAEIV